MQPCSHTRRPRDRAVVCDENPLFNLVRLRVMVQSGGFVCVGTCNNPLALFLLLGSVQRRVFACGVPKSCFQADAVTLWVFDKGGCCRSSPNTKPRILAFGSLVGPRLAIFGFGLVVVTRSHSRPVGELSTCGRRGEGFSATSNQGGFCVGIQSPVYPASTPPQRPKREGTNPLACHRRNAARGAAS